MRADVRKLLENMVPVAATGEPLSLHPEDPLALLEQGWLYNQAGEYEKAIEVLGRSFERDPHWPGLAFELAHAYAGLNDSAKAIEVLRVALDEHPGDYLLEKQIGYAYQKLGDLEQARAHLEQSLRLCPAGVEGQRAELAFQLGQVYTDRGDTSEARRWFDLAREIEWWISEHGHTRPR